MNYKRLGFALAIACGSCSLLLCRSVMSDTPPNSAREFKKLLAKKAGEVRDDNGLKMKFVWCPPGEFEMGSPESDEDAYDCEKPQVAVRLTEGFWLARTEATQSQWETIAGTTPWKGKYYVKEGADYPATFVNWDDVTSFCRKFTEQERNAGRLPVGWAYALPTEAQWEYACRAATKSIFSFGDDELLYDHAWYGGGDRIGSTKSEHFAHRVGLKEANPWGLCDMHGNVAEWCQDWHVSPLTGGNDPPLRAVGLGRVLRGGDWSAGPKFCRSAYRGGDVPSNCGFTHGFRLALIHSESK